MLPRAELHLHLEGSIEPETLRAINSGLSLEEIEANTRMDGSFAGFLQAFIWVNRHLQKPEHYAVAARGLIETLQREGVTYAEVTLSAGVVLWKGMDLAAAYEAIWRECEHAPVKVRWILDAIRHFGADAAQPVVEFAARHRNDGVIAFGIGGDEVRGPAAWFRDTFQFARDAGLHLVAHAGETAGPESIRAALAIGAERIGHGITAVQDPGLMAELRARDLPLEVCVTSNVCTGAVTDLESHPVRQLFDAGVPIVLGTDDPALFRTTLDCQYATLKERFGFTEEELQHINRNAFRYAFERF